MTSSSAPSVTELIRRLDAAVEAPDDGARCQRIRAALEWGAEHADELLSEDLVRPCESQYARRLLHVDPAGRWSAVLMVWGAEQSTPLHDHAGSWCVECVYRGRIRVDSYDRVANRCSRESIYDFRKVETIRAGVGESGALIPPFEYHVIANDDAGPAVTVHVYGGEMLRCTVFEPVEGGGYRAQERELSYTD